MKVSEPVVLDATIDELTAMFDECERLRSRVKELEGAFKIDVWSEEERDGMAAAFDRASARHGHYESLFAVAAFILRYRARTALQGKGE